MCAYMLTSMCTGGARGGHQILVFFFTLESGARLVDPLSPLITAFGITGVCHHFWLLTWLLGTELRSFILARQALLPH